MATFTQLVSAIVPLVGPSGLKEMWVIWNVDDEHEKLKRTYLTFQKLVDRVGVRSLNSICGGNNEWQPLFKKLREHGYDADALLDQISVLLPSLTNQESHHLRRMIQYSPKELISLPHKIAEMRKDLDGLTKEAVHSLNIERITSDDNMISGRSPAMSSYSFIMPRSVVGRDNDKDYIVNLLHTTTTNFSVIFIMGMCGIGKTTVARLAYNEASFDKKIWVSLSIHFDAIKITKSIIEAANGEASNLSDLEPLQLQLQAILAKSKFLIVLDNYWSENVNDWNTLSRPFQSGSQGSKVIVTTRNKKVSSIVGSDSHEEYILEVLSDDVCWTLIKEREMMMSVESVGMQIAKKCKGVPLVAKTFRNELRGKFTEEQWRLVLEGDMLDMLQHNNILIDLMQIYKHLPTHLRKCFAYCSIFPQGYEFEKEELINLWIAEGYVQSTTPRTSQRLAESYFEDLHSRFFFYQYSPASNQKHITYKMRDLIHGMAQLVSKDICSHIKHGESNYGDCLFGNACHLSLLHDGIQPLQLKASKSNERLRTFLVMNSSSNACATAIVDPHLFFHLKFLRVLGLGGAGLAELVDSIEQLQSLRYLNLTDNPISHLPKSVCTIVALQILKLRNCPKLSDLPEEMSSLINLKHLEFDENMFTSMPPHFRKLDNLEFLSAYTVAKKNGCGIGELKSLNGLNGSFCIRKIEFSNASEAKEANLDSKSNLNKLELSWSRLGQYSTSKKLEQDDVFAELRPHIKLEKLEVTNYFGFTYPSWLSDPSHNFTSIHLKGLKYCSNLPCLGELPKLKSFSISNMPCLRLIRRAFYGANNTVKFPSLESFELCGLSWLTGWEDVNGNNNVMPHLHAFKLNDCPELYILPQKLQALLPAPTVTGCRRLQQ